MSIVSAQEIDYKQETYSHPSYKYLQFYSNTYGQAVNITQSLSQIVFNLPPNECINFSKSYLTWTDQFGAIAAGTYAWIPNDTCVEIQRIQLQPSNSTWICDLDYMQNYLQIVSKSETSFDEFMNGRDPYLEFMTPCNCPNINNLRVDSTSTINVDNTFTPAISSGVQNYVEPSYLYQFAGTGAIYYLQRMLKLGDIKNSFFSLDKDFYFGGQISYLRLYIGPISKVAWTTTNAADPVTGAASYDGLLLKTISMNNITLYLAIESNELIRQDIINKVSSSGLRYMIPYVQSYKNSYGNVTSQQITIQFDLSLGKALKKIYHAIYNGSETGALVYEHSNIDATRNILSIPPVYGKRLSNWWTLLNGKRQQDITMNSLISPTLVANNLNSSIATAGLIPTDYMSLKNKLKGSVISNSAVYEANFFWLDDWSGFSSIQIFSGVPHLFSGIPMSAVALVWTFNGSVMGAAMNAHYTFAIFYRELMISTSLVTVN